MPTLPNPWIREVSPEEVFLGADDVLLSVAEKKVPFKLKARVEYHDPERLGLILPKGWWRFIRLEPGLEVKLTRLYLGGLYNLWGVILEAQPGQRPVAIRHENTVERSQRRFFYRVRFEQPFRIQSALLPDGQAHQDLTGSLEDISAGGIGFSLNVFLPPSTQLRADNLLSPILVSAQGVDSRLEVVWCRASRPRGYRLGARFLYESKQEQELMVKLMNQLQRQWLSRYYHVIGERNVPLKAGRWSDSG